MFPASNHHAHGLHTQLVPLLLNCNIPHSLHLKSSSRVSQSTGLHAPENESIVSSFESFGARNRFLPGTGSPAALVLVCKPATKLQRKNSCWKLLRALREERFALV